MNIRRSIWAGTLVVAALLLAVALSGTTAAQSTLTPEEELGKAIFFDVNLSLNGNQSCATCHAPQSGWTGPDSAINADGSVYEGSIEGAFGDRKPPSAAYATQSPVLSVDKLGTFSGGNFWDGRATGRGPGQPRRRTGQGSLPQPQGAGAAERGRRSSTSSARPPMAKRSRQSGAPPSATAANVAHGLRCHRPLDRRL